MTDGIDNLNADGTFTCGHGAWNAGAATWKHDRWMPGTAPAEYYASFMCGNSHHIDVPVPREAFGKRPIEAPTPEVCTGTIDGDGARVPCPSHAFRATGRGMRGENCGTWPYDAPLPRTCSYCGGVHPDDLVELIRAGFQWKGSDKSYKAYIEGPDGGPTPPVKAYGNHLSREHQDAINALIKARSAAAS